MVEQRKRLRVQLHEAILRLGYSPKTEKSYAHWIRRYIFFHHKAHPADMGEQHIETFLTHLAVRRRVSPSTRNQALNALLFLYKIEIEGTFLRERISGDISRRRAVDRECFKCLGG